MEKLTLKKKRMLLYFIEATQKIIDQDGFDNVTIRKISTEAGYNSATLYNYYEDLDLLLQFACVEYLITYQNKLIRKIKNLTNPKEIYFETWILFSSECYSHPKVYYHLFFSKHKDKIHETFYRYLELFDIKYDFDTTKKVFSFITLPDLVERHTILLESLAEQKLIEDTQISEKANMLVLIFESMLNSLRNNPESCSKEDFINNIVTYSSILLHLK